MTLDPYLKPYTKINSIWVKNQNIRVSVLQDKKVLEICCTTVWIHITLLNCTLKVVKMENFCYFLPQLKNFNVVANNSYYLLSAYSVPGPATSTLYTLSHYLIYSLQQPRERNYCFPSFSRERDRLSEVKQLLKVTQQQVLSPGLEPWSRCSWRQIFAALVHWPVSSKSPARSRGHPLPTTPPAIFILQHWSFQHSFHTITSKYLLWEHWPKLCLRHVTIICNINRTRLSVSKHCSCHWQFMLIPEIQVTIFEELFCVASRPRGPWPA